MCVTVYKISRPTYNFSGQDTNVIFKTDRHTDKKTHYSRWADSDITHTNLEATELWDIIFSEVREAISYKKSHIHYADCCGEIKINLKKTQNTICYWAVDMAQWL